VADQQVDDNPVRIARADQATYGIPERDYQAWRSQYNSAKRRGIPFRFSLLGWRIWWQGELAKLGPDAKRGNRVGCYMMARKRDRGAYEHGNVYAATPRDNARDIPADVRVAMTEQATAACKARGKPRGVHLKVRGDGHPKSHAVMTPAGRFGSIALASEAHGITRAGGLHRVRTGVWTLAT